MNKNRKVFYAFYALLILFTNFLFNSGLLDPEIIRSFQSAILIKVKGIGQNTIGYF